MRSEHPTSALLEWAPSAIGGWDLHGDHGPLARLVPGERSWLAEAGTGAWTVQRVGFHRPRVVVRPLGGLAEVAHLQADWRGLHALRFVAGPTWEIDPTHSGGTVLRDGAGRPRACLSWHRLDAAAPRVQTDTGLVADRFGPLALALVGWLTITGFGDRTGKVAIGVQIGETAREWN
ncbi:MAG: hypothetical protein ACK4YP_13730 [Myxococcota bacterium]